MIRTTTTTRVRYADTDKMGVVYHANYAVFYEVGRTEMFRELGLTYAKMEELGVMLPVVELHSNFHRSALYDETLTIVTEMREMPDVRVRFDYQILNEKGQVLNTGYTVLVFFDMKRNRPTRMPDYVREVLVSRFLQESLDIR